MPRLKNGIWRSCLRRWIDGNIAGFIYNMVAVPYIDSFYDFLSFPVYKEKNVSAHRAYNGAFDSGECDGSDYFGCGGYGENLSIDLYSAKPVGLLVYFKRQKGKFFFTFCLADTVAYWIMIVTNVLDFYFGGEQYILMFIGRLLLFPLVEWWTVKRLRKPYLELQESVAGGWGIFAGMTALYYTLLAVKAYFPVAITSRPQELPAFLLILVLMPMTYATIFAALYRQLLLYRKRQSELILLKQKNILEGQLENQQRMRKMKHDMKGYTQRL